MALANGVLVHGPTSWACAVRTAAGDAEGRVRAQASRSPSRRTRRSCAGRPGCSRRCSCSRACAASCPEARFAFERAERGRGDGRGGRRRAGDPTVRAPLAGGAGARRRRDLARPGADRAARRRAGRLPRRRAHLDRHVRARPGRPQGARALRLAPRRPADPRLGGRRRPGSARPRSACASPRRSSPRSARSPPRRRSFGWMVRNPEQSRSPGCSPGPEPSCRAGSRPQSPRRSRSRSRRPR